MTEKAERHGGERMRHHDGTSGVEHEVPIPSQLLQALLASAGEAWTDSPRSATVGARPVPANVR
jgi:hypothetical protein